MVAPEREDHTFVFGRRHTENRRRADRQDRIETAHYWESTQIGQIERGALIVLRCEAASTYTIAQTSPVSRKLRQSPLGHVPKHRGDQAIGRVDGNGDINALP